jgi:GNAT superfamily N-acetyltransferase
MIEIRPMDETYLHLTCLHEGPVDPATIEPRPDPLRGGHPPLPWSEETLRMLAEQYRTHKLCHPRPAPFMREMIRRYGTCAMLAWKDREVVGHLRFYPMQIARLFVPPADDRGPRMLNWAGDPGEDEGTLWVQCVMTARPYVSPRPDTITGRNWPAMDEAGARRGVGLKLASGLIDWARTHGWRRIVKIAHADVDCLYGQLGAAGKAFWEKAGFQAVAHFYLRPDWSADYMALAEAQGRQRALTAEEVWTWHRMRYEL